MNVRSRVTTAALCFLFFCFSTVQQVQSAPRLRAGAVIYLTGPTSYIGRQMQQGMMLCADPGKVEIVFEDSQYSPVMAVNAFNKLANVDRVDLVMVSGSGMANAVAPLARRMKLPLLVTAVSSNSVFQAGGEVIVRYFSSADEEASVMAGFLKMKAGKTSAAVLRIADEYGQAYGDGFVRHFKEGGGSIVTSETFTQDENDFRPHLLRIIRAAPDVLYFVGLPGHVLTFMRQAKEIRPPFLITSNLIPASPDVYRSREDLMEGVYFTSPAWYGDAGIRAREFHEKFVKANGTDPSVWAAIGCDLSLLINDYGSANPQEFRKSVDALEGFKGVMGGVISRKNGDLSFPICISRFRVGAVQYCVDEREQPVDDKDRLSHGGEQASVD